MNYQEKVNFYNQSIANIANALLEQMKEGADNWEMPWHKGIQPAINARTGKQYRRNNHLILWSKFMTKEYKYNQWATLNQWSKMRAKVKRGEKGTLICVAIPRTARIRNNSQLSLYDSINPPDVISANPYFRFIFRYVFNEAQVNGYFGNQPTLFDDHLPGEVKLKKLVKESGAKITEAGDRAYYSSITDSITIPPYHKFIATQESTKEDNYYSTLLHEIIHWTGHHSRCKRQLGNSFGDPVYAFEELIAELGSAILCTQLNQRIVPRIDHAQYLNSWLKVLESDFSYFNEALELARTAIFYLNELTSIFPDLKLHRKTEINTKRLSSWKELATK
jgi:antirestriction protein ArdC